MAGRYDDDPFEKYSRFFKRIDAAPKLNEYGVSDQVKVMQVSSGGGAVGGESGGGRKHTDGKGNVTTVAPKTGAPPAAIDVPVEAVAQEVLTTGDPQRDRYNAFLRDQFISPSSFGAGYADPSYMDESGQLHLGKIKIPTVKQQEKAMRANNAANALEGDLLEVADYYRPKVTRGGGTQGNPEITANAMQKVRELNLKRGSSYEERMQYYMNDMYPALKIPSNGFSR